MAIPSLKCALPCCIHTKEKQTKSSLIIRMIAVGLGNISLLAGVLTFCGILGLHALGTIGGSMLIGLGGTLILASACLKCIKPNKPLTVKKDRPTLKQTKPVEIAVEGELKTEQAYRMTHDLGSCATLATEESQYLIDEDDPVSLTLRGTQSCCCLKVHDPKLKKFLSQVGIDFERAQKNTFFNFSHTFTSIANNKKVKDIFEFVNEAIQSKANDKLKLDLADVNQFIVEKTEDRSKKDSQPTSPLRTYALDIEISEKAVEQAKKSGLIFKEIVCTT